MRQIRQILQLVYSYEIDESIAQTLTNCQDFDLKFQTCNDFIIGTTENPGQVLAKVEGLPWLFNPTTGPLI